MRNLLVLSLTFFLSTCSNTPSFAKVLPGVWDGTCISIHQNKYMKQNPEDIKKETGFIPKKLQSDDSDISACLPVQLPPEVKRPVDAK